MGPTRCFGPVTGKRHRAQRDNLSEMNLKAAHAALQAAEQEIIQNAIG